MPQAWNGNIAMRAGVIVHADEVVLVNFGGTGRLGFAALRVGQPNDCDLNQYVLRVYPEEAASLEVYRPFNSPISYWD